SLNHPHICTLHDIGSQGDVDYLVMEHLSGETLQARLGRGPVAPSVGLRWAVQVASALDAAHRAGIIHRDLKPANIFLVASGGSPAPTAKVPDFGPAKTTDPRVSEGREGGPLERRWPRPNHTLRKFARPRATLLSFCESTNDQGCSHYARGPGRPIGTA